MIEIPDIDYSAYGGKVHYDENSSYSGTSYPIGSSNMPVNNLDDAFKIMKERGLNPPFELVLMRRKMKLDKIINNIK